MEPVKTKRIKSFRLEVGDKVVDQFTPWHLARKITSIRELSKDSLTVDFEHGGMGIYRRRNFVTILKDSNNG